MKYLHDTCAVSELRRPDCEPAAKRLIEAVQDDELFLSVITFGELQKGISLLDQSRRRQDLEGWLSALEALYSDRILPVTRETVRIWGELTARCQRKGHSLGVSDGLIAATALQHGLHVITRNERDFEPTGILISNPWA